MPRPRSLTPDRLASAALAVLDRDGLAGLSMRTVAKELGMSTMALYRYVADRDELERLVVEFALGAVDTGAPSADLPWRERVEIMVRRLRDALSAHPSVIPLSVAHRHHSRAVLRWSETVLGILTGAGFEGERRVVALRGLVAQVNGALQLAQLGSLAGEGTAAISALAPEEFPLMAETAAHARRVDADQEFFGGLAVFLRGLEA
ncbi:TetR/AcrR family transcriptional regulator C-terminal domain-containing protein [Streptomyces sp. NPDC052109]|uniref:TetR/AcrR family transcriptional regulator n=1 Tax=Streptomyces sp. NPDC052109 TaxID=3155527 RepID=UPI003413FB1A